MSSSKFSAEGQKQMRVLYHRMDILKAKRSRNDIGEKERFDYDREYTALLWATQVLETILANTDMTQ